MTGVGVGGYLGSGEASARVAVERGDSGRSSGTCAGSGGGRNRRRLLATPAASDGAIPAKGEAKWQSVDDIVFSGEWGVRWCAQMAWRGTLFIGRRVLCYFHK